MAANPVVVPHNALLSSEKEQELREKASDLATELTHMKIAAHRDKMQAIAEYKQREEDLQHEVERLRLTLSHYGINPSKH